MKLMLADFSQLRTKVKRTFCGQRPLKWSSKICLKKSNLIGFPTKKKKSLENTKERKKENAKEFHEMTCFSCWKILISWTQGVKLRSLKSVNGALWFTNNRIYSVHIRRMTPMSNTWSSASACLLPSIALTAHYCCNAYSLRSRHWYISW